MSSTQIHSNFCLVYNEIVFKIFRDLLNMAFKMFNQKAFCGGWRENERNRTEEVGEDRRKEEDGGGNREQGEDMEEISKEEIQGEDMGD